MTTIAYKDGILASDSQTTWYGSMKMGSSQKIFDLGDKLVGFTGHVSLQEEALKFLKGEEFDKEIFKDDDLEMDVLVIYKDSGKIATYTRKLKKEEIEVDFIAIGSGLAFALGAMEMGASAEEAIKVASKYDIKTDNRVKTLSILS